MPCNWDDITEDYSDDLFDLDLFFLDDPDKTDGIYATDSERDATKYIIDKVDYFELSVYNKDNHDLYHLFGQHPMSSDFLSSDRFAREYSNSLYTFIERIADSPVNKDDIGGVIIYPREGGY